MEKSVEKIAEIVDGLIGKSNTHTVVEIGAKDCEETVGMAGQFAHAHIYSFECNPATLPLCRKRVEGNSAITLIEKAISNINGAVTFFPIDQQRTKTPWADGNPGASSLLRASGKYKKETYIQNEITVSSVTLSSFIEQSSLTEIDLLWMDIQGAELMALKSAQEKISIIKIIHLEVEFVEIYSNQPLMVDIKRYLNANNFSLYGFTNFGRYSGDAVFVNNSLCEKKFYFRDKFIYDWYRYIWMYPLFISRKLQKLF